MGRKSKYDKLVDSITGELDRLSHRNAATVEQAIANEQRICNAFGMKPSSPGSYDYCPLHPSRVRYNGQCSDCND